MKTKAWLQAIPVIFLSMLTSCVKEFDPSNKDEVAALSINKQLNSRDGVIYTESNDANTNDIISYRQNSNGTLTYLSATASGGNGSNSALASQGALQMLRSKNFLFAVNAGSNSISSFAIDQDGGLTLAATVSSNGVFPVSLTVHAYTLYVVNSASANISGFTIGSGGSLTYINGSNQSLSNVTATPAQINFTTDGNYLVVTEKMTKKITRFPVNSSGVAGAGSSITCVNMTPFGFGFSGNYAIVSDAAGGSPNAGTVSSYADGANLVSGPVHANQTAACWVEITQDGKYAYVSNTGSNTLSLFGISKNGMVNVISTVAATTGMAPADLALSSNDFYLYVINGMSHSISEYKKGANTNLQSIGEIKDLPTFATGLIAF